jgi:hypothetical protein
MKNRKLLSALLIILGVALFFGCSQLVGTDAAAERKAVTPAPFPEGEWVDSQFLEEFDLYEGGTISYSIGGAPIYEGTFYSYIPDPDDDDSGIIYLQYSEDTPYGTPGYYYAVRFERLNLEADTIWLSGCADGNGKKYPEDAEDEYSEANKDIYFKYGSECQRKPKGLRIEPPTGPFEKPAFLKHLEEQTGKIIIM